MKISIEVDVPARRIADMMVSAIEGNDMVASWCDAINLDETIFQGIKGFREGTSLWYDTELLFSESYRHNLKFTVTEVVDEATGETKDHIVTGDDVAKGLVVMARSFSRHFGDLMNEEDDNTTSDVFLQCVVFKDVIYG
jgi:hypothetical protein